MAALTAVPEAAAPDGAEDGDAELVARIQAELTPDAIAAALVRALRTDLPAAEDILGAGGRAEADRGPRAGFEGAAWFRINAGRRHNADPRWLLPIICRYGHVPRTEIGAIRIAANESWFQVTERAAPGFVKALRRATVAPEEEGLVIEPAEPRAEPPRIATKPRGKPGPKADGAARGWSPVSTGE